jgi:hypothetical protein
MAFLSLTKNKQVWMWWCPFGDVIISPFLRYTKDHCDEKSWPKNLVTIKKLSSWKPLKHDRKKKSLGADGDYNKLGPGAHCLIHATGLCRQAETLKNFLKRKLKFGPGDLAVSCNPAALEA